MVVGAKDMGGRLHLEEETVWLKAHPIISEELDQ